MALLGEEGKQQHSVYHQAFVRDGGRCVYCDLDVLQSFDSFAASHLDHLKPKKNGGADNEPWNRVIACGVCNSLKGPFDPLPGEVVTPSTFKQWIDCASKHISEKRGGTRDNSYWRDYQHWLTQMKRTDASQETPLK